MKISVIIPALNEAASIQATLLPLQPLRQGQHEVILVDGGSIDNTIELAQALTDKIITSPKGRARQMNAGAKQAHGDVYWFLHSDTLAPENADKIIKQHLHDSGRHWGRFNIHLSGQQFIFRLIAWMMNTRSRITGIATGDQGIFIKAGVFNKLKGFKAIPLMEDIEISKRLLAQYGRPVCIGEKLLTSSRRWEQQGIIKTILLMWQLRLAYFLGCKPETLARYYFKN